MESQRDLERATIADFGQQWTRFTSNDGYYGSSELFADILGPLQRPSDFEGRTVLDIGSGTGRIISMLLAAGAGRVIGVEPSVAFDVLQASVRRLGDTIASRTTLIQCTGADLPPDLRVDRVVSIGVLHHIPDPAPVVTAAFRALRNGGTMLVWLYGVEGNRLYLWIANPLRWLTRRIPRGFLNGLVWTLYFPLMAYTALCSVLPLPLGDYLRNVLVRMSPDKRRLVIYDQLNPAYAKYYTRAEAEALLSGHGFRNVRSHHRRGYSWTVLGEKPGELGASPARAP